MLPARQAACNPLLAPSNTAKGRPWAFLEAQWKRISKLHFSHTWPDLTRLVQGQSRCHLTDALAFILGYSSWVGLTSKVRSGTLQKKKKKAASHVAQASLELAI